MNVDHFFWIDTEDLRAPPPSTSVKFSALGKPKRFSLEDDLLADFRELPKRKSLDLDDFAVVNVGPSVVPTYMPSLRVFTYNVSAVEEEEGEDDEDDGEDGDAGSEGKKKKKKKGDKRKHGHR